MIISAQFMCSEVTSNDCVLLRVGRYSTGLHTCAGCGIWESDTIFQPSRSATLSTSTSLVSRDDCWTACQNMHECSGAEWQASSSACLLKALGEVTNRDNNFGWDSIRSCDPGRTLAQILIPNKLVVRFKQQGRCRQHCVLLQHRCHPKQFSAGTRKGLKNFTARYPPIEL